MFTTSYILLMPLTSVYLYEVMINSIPTWKIEYSNTPVYFQDKSIYLFITFLFHFYYFKKGKLIANSFPNFITKLFSHLLDFFIPFPSSTTLLSSEFQTFPPYILHETSSCMLELFLVPIYFRSNYFLSIFTL